MPGLRVGPDAFWTWAAQVAMIRHAQGRPGLLEDGRGSGDSR